MQNLYGVDQLPLLESFDASDNLIGDIAPLDTTSLPYSVRELRLANNAIVDVSALGSYNALSTLWLSGNTGIDFQQLRPIIDQNPQLTRLGIGGIDVQEPGLPWFNIDRPAVVELDVSDTGIEGLWGIEEYASLQVLDASDNVISDLLPLAWQSLPDTVRELDLAHNAILDVGALFNYHNLSTLWLSGNAGIDFLQLRWVIEQNPQLTRLGIGGIDVQEPGLPWLNIDRAGVVELDVSDTGIDGLWGIEEYVSLQALNASDNTISDLFPLAALPESLRVLRLANNAIVDVSSLGSYHNLSTLWLSGNTGINFQQLQPIIEQNPQLTRLGIGGIDVQKPGLPWFNIDRTGMVELDVSATGIEGLWGIEEYVSLQVLDASDNTITDLFPLAALPLPDSVRELRLANNAIVDVSALGSYNALSTLWLSGNAGIDFQQLRPIIEQNPQLTRLGIGGIDVQEPGLPWFDIDRAGVVELDVSNTGIDGLWGIEEYASLQGLDASDNTITDLFPLAALPLPDSVRELRLANNAIVDVSALGNYLNLSTLWLSGNTGIDFQQLRPIIDQNPQLTRLGIGGIDVQEPGLPWFNIDRPAVLELDVSGTGINGLWGIEEYVSLQVLDASDNTITDLFPLAVLPDTVRELRLANNAIVDVDGLFNYHNLSTLWLSGNPGIDIQQLRPIIEQNPQLTRLGIGGIDVQEPSLPWFNIDRPAVVELDVSDTGIDGLWGIEQYAALQVLDASDNAISDLYPLAVLSGTVRELRLANNAIVDVSALDNYNALSTLWLSGNAGIDFLQLRPIIEQNPQLTRLGIGGIDIQDPGLPWFNIDRAGVVELDVSDTGIDAVWGIEEYASLQVLDASDNLIYDITPLFNLNTLELVDLRGNTTIPCEQLDQLEQVLGPASNAVLRPASCVIGQAPDVMINQPVDGLVIFEGQPLTLSAEASDAEDGDISASIQWSSDLSGALGAGASLQVSLQPGVQVLLATVTDSDGNTVSQSVDISVQFNDPPVVQIDAPAAGTAIVEGEQLVLDGSASDTEDGDLSAAIQWASDIDGALGNGTGLNVTLTPGMHTLTAAVTDQWGKAAQATTTVTVAVNAPPAVTISEPAGDVTLTEGESLVISGTASDAEDGVLTDAIQWSSDLDGALGTGASVGVVLSVGTHQLSATVTDSHGKTGMASRQVTVQFNDPPQLTMVSPDDGQQIEQYLPLVLSAVAIDQEDGDLSAGITWSSDVSGALGTAGSLTVTLPLGAHVITATITDGNGKTATITRNVSVIAPPAPGYCSVGGSTKSMWIEGVTIAGVTNNSGSQGGYADFSGLGPIYLDRSSNVVALVPGFSHKSQNTSWSVWIDLNRDGTFSGNEILLTAVSDTAVASTVTIPPGADSGLTRMRVMMSRNDIADACLDLRAGETEDYAVVLLP